MGSCRSGWSPERSKPRTYVAITGFSEMGEGRLEAIYVAEVLAGELRPVGQVRFGFAGKGLWPALDALRAGPRRKGGFIRVRVGLRAEVKFFGRHKGGYIRDGVILSLAAKERSALSLAARL